LQDGFQQEVAALLNRGNNTKFPGAQPVSFSAEHIEELKHQDYYVCEKTDGVRYLMWFTEDGAQDIHYLIDRKNNYWFVPGLHFPHNEDKSFQRYHKDTILDGELVEDRIPGRESVIKFFVFDCLVLNKLPLMHRPLDKRLGYFKVNVLEPYKKMYQTFPEEPRPFIMEDKATEFSYGLEKMFKEIIPKVKALHGNDGLIFTCKNTPYKCGTDDHILKWKPPEENTIDFLLRIEWAMSPPEPQDPDQSYHPDYFTMPTRFSLLIHTGKNEYSQVSELHVEPQEWEDMKALNHPLQDIIIECYQDDRQRWRYHRFRHDKDQSNHVSVYQSVIRSIQSHVTEEDLLNHAADIRAAWKRRDEEAKKRAGSRPGP
jgi:mRNA guanylyltransferase